MSPEHVKDPRNVDGRADLWSLGVVAYRLLSTRFPFPGESTGEVLAAILESRPAKLRAIGVDVPEEIDRIIDQCLKRDRDERFQEVGMLARAFAPYASPRWRDYATRVPQIVATSSVPSPGESTARKRKKVAEPSTATVPPPIDDDPATMNLDEQSARQLLPSSLRPWSDITGPMRVVEAVPSPLEVLSTGPIPLMRAPEPKPKRWGVVALVVLLMIGAASSFVVITRMRARTAATAEPTVVPPATTTVAAPVVPPSSASSAPPVVASAEPVPASAPAPGRSTKPGRIARPAPSPKPAPAPHEAPAPKKPDLEGNPYGKPPVQ